LPSFDSGCRQCPASRLRRPVDIRVEHAGVGPFSRQRSARLTAVVDLTPPCRSRRR
jgi:hypothetical protein